MTGPVLCAVDVSNPHRDANVLRAAARMATLDAAKLDVITVMPDYGLSVVGSFSTPAITTRPSRKAGSGCTIW